jgi:hypothetical protein
MRLGSGQTAGASGAKAIYILLLSPSITYLSP